MKNSSLEIWKPVRGLEQFFEVSSWGRVKSLKRTFTTGNNGVQITKQTVILKTSFARGYEQVLLSIQWGEFKFRRSVKVHRLVAQEFCENKLNRKEVNHIDGNKKNNHADNLEWVSTSENIRHSYLIGLRPKPTGNRKFSDETITKVFELRKKNYMHKEIAKELGMGQSTVTHILLGTRRK